MELIKTMPASDRALSPATKRSPGLQLRALASKYYEAQRVRGERVDDDRLQDYDAALRYVQLLAEEQLKIDAAKQQVAMEKTKSKIDKHQQQRGKKRGAVVNTATTTTTESESEEEPRGRRM